MKRHGHVQYTVAAVLTRLYGNELEGGENTCMSGHTRAPTHTPLRCAEMLSACSRFAITTFKCWLPQQRGDLFPN